MLTGGVLITTLEVTGEGDKEMIQMCIARSVSNHWVI